jgi:DNA-directed RNA polymerase specialized sigma24 family protein
MAFNSFNKNKTEPLGETQYKDTKISIFDKTSRNETLEIIGKILSAMSDPRRTVVRMHLKEIQAEIIMEKLNITATQYRLHLSRGLDELEEKTKRKLKWSA